jgi:hypothetical protein
LVVAADHPCFNNNQRVRWAAAFLVPGWVPIAGWLWRILQPEAVFGDFAFYVLSCSEKPPIHNNNQRAWVRIAFLGQATAQAAG